ncbi:hypothetical protein HDU76_005744, partial [Blyttiomyces sp. JEL0837]
MTTTTATASSHHQGLSSSTTSSTISSTASSFDYVTVQLQLQPSISSINSTSAKRPNHHHHHNHHLHHSTHSTHSTHHHHLSKSKSPHFPSLPQVSSNSPSPTFSAHAARQLPPHVAKSIVVSSSLTSTTITATATGTSPITTISSPTSPTSPSQQQQPSQLSELLALYASRPGVGLEQQRGITGIGAEGQDSQHHHQLPPMSPPPLLQDLGSPPMIVTELLPPSALPVFQIPVAGEGLSYQQHQQYYQHSVGGNGKVVLQNHHQQHQQHHHLYQSLPVATLPLQPSLDHPSVKKGVVDVDGLDHKIHFLDGDTSSLLSNETGLDSDEVVAPATRVTDAVVVDEGVNGTNDNSGDVDSLLSASSFNNNNTRNSSKPPLNSNNVVTTTTTSTTTKSRSKRLSVELLEYLHYETSRSIPSSQSQAHSRQHPYPSIHHQHHQQHHRETTTTGSFRVPSFIDDGKDYNPRQHLFAVGNISPLLISSPMMKGFNPSTAVAATTTTVNVTANVGKVGGGGRKSGKVGGGGGAVDGIATRRMLCMEEQEGGLGSVDGENGHGENESAVVVVQEVVDNVDGMGDVAGKGDLEEVPVGDGNIGVGKGGLLSMEESLLSSREGLGLVRLDGGDEVAGTMMVPSGVNVNLGLNIDLVGGVGVGHSAKENGGGGDLVYNEGDSDVDVDGSTSSSSGTSNGNGNASSSTTGMSRRFPSLRMRNGRFGGASGDLDTLSTFRSSSSSTSAREPISFVLPSKGHLFREDDDEEEEEEDDMDGLGGDIVGRFAKFVGKGKTAMVRSGKGGGRGGKVRRSSNTWSSSSEGSSSSDDDVDYYGRRPGDENNNCEGGAGVNDVVDEEEEEEEDEDEGEDRRLFATSPQSYAEFLSREGRRVTCGGVNRGVEEVGGLGSCDLASLSEMGVDVGDGDCEGDDDDGVLEFGFGGSVKRAGRGVGNNKKTARSDGDVEETEEGDGGKEVASTATMLTGRPSLKSVFYGRPKTTYHFGSSASSLSSAGSSWSSIGSTSEASNSGVSNVVAVRGKNHHHLLRQPPPAVALSPTSVWNGLVDLLSPTKDSKLAQMVKLHGERKRKGGISSALKKRGKSLSSRESSCSSVVSNKIDGDAGGGVVVAMENDNNGEPAVVVNRKRVSFAETPVLHHYTEWVERLEEFRRGRQSAVQRLRREEESRRWWGGLLVCGWGGSRDDSDDDEEEETRRRRVHDDDGEDDDGDEDCDVIGGKARRTRKLRFSGERDLGERRGLLHSAKEGNKAYGTLGSRPWGGIGGGGSGSALYGVEGMRAGGRGLGVSGGLMNGGGGGGAFARERVREDDDIDVEDDVGEGLGCFAGVVAGVEWAFAKVSGVAGWCFIGEME